MMLSISKYKENGAKIFTDRDSGVKARQELALDTLEQTEKIIIQIPRDTWGINPSFFGGLFETTIKNYRERFFEIYSFQYTNGEDIKESLKKDIEDNYEYVLNCLN